MDTSDGRVRDCSRPRPAARADRRHGRGPPGPSNRVDHAGGLDAGEVFAVGGRGDDVRPTASDTLLVVEVVSPNTVTADLVEKRAEYARLGIPYYWIVRMVQDDGPAASIETLRLTAEGIYVLERMSLRARGDATAIDAADPLTVTISWNQLDLGLD
ncbi:MULTISPECIES: Uma2 family endonuclease [unclassified Nocardia]|uniref:Uma2 family endonuclease n=1 Tax=unclassified Nocardia TaxID=2637762 RepID=UPI00278C099E|nr:MULTISPECIES: Uma2 family endonuclease [unclassified Nocardia]